MSEHVASSGRVVFEAWYQGDRFNSYRAYKFPAFVGRPAEPPRLVARAYNGMTLFAVSWNGATEVHSWAFFGSRTEDYENNTNNNSSSSRSDHNDKAGFEEIGRSNRSGFETTFASPQLWTRGYAQALAANGSVIGESDVVTARIEGPGLAAMATAVGAGRPGSGSWLVKASLFILGLLLGCIASTALMLLLLWRRRPGRNGYRLVRSADNRGELEEMSILNSAAAAAAAAAAGGDGLDHCTSDKDDEKQTLSCNVWPCNDHGA